MSVTRRGDDDYDDACIILASLACDNPLSSEFNLLCVQSEIDPSVPPRLSFVSAFPRTKSRKLCKRGARHCSCAAGDIYLLSFPFCAGIIIWADTLVQVRSLSRKFALEDKPVCVLTTAEFDRSPRDSKFPETGSRPAATRVLFRYASLFFFLIPTAVCTTR